MKVKTLVRFQDLKADVIREVGEEFTVSKARFKEILSVGPFVEEVPAKQEKEPEAE